MRLDEEINFLHNCPSSLVESFEKGPDTTAAVHSSGKGFSRLDLLAVLGALALLGFLVVPSLAVSGPDSARAVCHSNLRQLGHALQVWANDHYDNVPWAVPMQAGGTRPDSGSKTGIAWTEFSTVSNLLTTPRVLACPADPRAKPASNWGGGSGGLVNSGFRNNAVSYLVAYHALPQAPQSVIAADRDVNSAGTSVGCSRGIDNAATIFRPPQFTAAWTNELHLNNGHLLLMDGSVEFTRNGQLTNSLFRHAAGDTASFHFVNPR